MSKEHWIVWNPESEQAYRANTAGEARRKAKENWAIQKWAMDYPEWRKLVRAGWRVSKVTADE